MTNENKLNISWNEPNNPNGYITQYILFRDNNQILNSFYNLNGYYTNDYLSNQYIDTLDDLDTKYEYKIAYSNSIGSLISDSQDYFMFNRIPYDIYNLEYRNLTNMSVVLNWFYNNSFLSPLFEYSFNNSLYNEIVNFTGNYNFYTFSLNNLNSNYDYNISIRAKYNNDFIGDESTISFTTLDYNQIYPDPPNPPDSPDTDNNNNYWYYILAGCLVLLILFLYIVFCCSNSNIVNNSITPQVDNNTTRVYHNPIYENQESQYGDESTYGDVSFNQRNVIINSNYNYIDDNNNDNDTIDTNSLEFSIPSRKITKRRSVGKLNDTLQRKDNLMDEIRQRVPDMVPKNMLEE